MNKLSSKYQHYKKVFELEKRSGLDMSVFQTIKRKFIIYKQHRRAFTIGKRAAQGYNMYLTFGSDKTICQNAQDSYKRYAMAMKHYNQVLCDENSFIEGYEVILNFN